jgi:hypothetical protein
LVYRHLYVHPNGVTLVSRACRNVSPSLPPHQSGHSAFSPSSSHPGSPHTPQFLAGFEAIVLELGQRRMASMATCVAGPMDNLDCPSLRIYHFTGALDRRSVLQLLKVVPYRTRTWVRLTLGTLVKTGAIVDRRIMRMQRDVVVMVGGKETATKHLNTQGPIPLNPPYHGRKV